jgi:hypothetical protein
VTAGPEYLGVANVQEKAGEAGGQHDQRERHGEKVDGDEGGDREGDESGVT